MLTTGLWFLSLIVLGVFLSKRGWRALPRWQRYYVVAAGGVAPFMVVFVDLGVPLPLPEFVIPVLVTPIFVAWLIIPFVGISAAIWQLRLLSSKTHPASGLPDTIDPRGPKGK
jgi:hypothetical protein